MSDGSGKSLLGKARERPDLSPLQLALGAQFLHI
jgi:hypothetical protein